MKKYLGVVIIGLMLFAGIVWAADTTYQTKVYKTDGGDREVVASGGIVDLESGGHIKVQSGGIIGVASGGILDTSGTWKINGTSVSANATQLNYLDYATGRTGTAKLVYDTSATITGATINSPSMVTPNIGAATGTSLSVTGDISGNSVHAADVSPTTVWGSGFTGTGTIVRSNTPTLVSPVLGAATGTSVSVTGNVSGNSVTAADVSSTTIWGSGFTGTGTIARSNTPTFVSPVLGAATGTSVSVTGNVSGNTVTAADVSPTTLWGSGFTGTGTIARSNTPTFVSPVLGAATGTSVNLAGDASFATGWGSAFTGTGGPVRDTSPSIAGATFTGNTLLSTIALGGTAVTATAANLNAIPTATGTGTEIDANTKSIYSSSSTVVVAATSTNISTVTFTLKDANGTAVTGVHVLRIYLAEDSSGATVCSVDASGAVTFTTGSIIDSHVSKRSWEVTTNNQGVAVLSVNNTGGGPYGKYAVLVLPNRKIVVSAVVDPGV